MNKYALIEYYNSLENKEINQLVAEAEGMNCVHERDGFICYQMNHGGSMKFDPCNTPNDAFPIMLKYEIAISPYSLSKDLPYYDKYKDMWFAMKDKDWYIDDKNPPTSSYDYIPDDERVRERICRGSGNPLNCSVRAFKGKGI